MKEQIDYPERSVKNYHFVLDNVPEDRRTRVESRVT